MLPILSSLVSFLVIFPRVRRNYFPIKSLFCHCYPLFDFLTTAHVATYSTSQIFEAVHLFNCLIWKSHVYLFVFLPITMIFAYLHISSFHTAHLYNLACHFLFAISSTNLMYFIVLPLVIIPLRFCKEFIKF